MKVSSGVVSLIVSASISASISGQVEAKKPPRFIHISGGSVTFRKLPERLKNRVRNEVEGSEFCWRKKTTLIMVVWKPAVNQDPAGEIVKISGRLLWLVEVNFSSRNYKSPNIRAEAQKREAGIPKTEQCGF